MEPRISKKLEFHTGKRKEQMPGASQKEISQSFNNFLDNLTGETRAKTMIA